jgi:sugar/nucleoside kinase (ribokinase family)
MKPFDVALFGPVFADHVLSGLPKLPALGEEVYAPGYRREAGGGCFITACGLAALGASATCFTMVGREDGQWLLDRAKSFGVTTDNVRFSELPTGVTVAASVGGDRAFLSFDGANGELAAWLESAELPPQLAAACHVHFACPLPPIRGLQMIQELHRLGATVSLDVGWQEVWLRDPAAWSLLAEVDLFLPNESEARLMTGKSAVNDMIATFASGGARKVAIKLGPNGAVYWNGRRAVRAPALEVMVVDTTGSGDAFNAGFLHGFLAGLPDETCLERGAICGSLSTRKAGALEAFPEMNEVLQYHGHGSKR